jgi:hypothetical protein
MQSGVNDVVRLIQADSGREIFVCPGAGEGTKGRLPGAQSVLKL